MSTTFETAAASVVGAAFVDRDERGITPRRLPAWALRQVTDGNVHMVAGMPSGVRLEVVTDASWIELDVLPTVYPTTWDSTDWHPAVFDLVVDGVVGEPVATTEGRRLVVNEARTAYEVRDGGPTRLRFDLPGHSARVELWLPHRALLTIVDVRVSDGATLTPAPQDGPLWVHYGSSISHCQEALRPTETWPALVARANGVRLQSLGLSGQAQLDQFVARTIRDLPADVISLKVGINVLNSDSMRERAFVPALHGFLDTVRDGHPTTPIVLATPIYCPQGEDNPGPTYGTDDGKTVCVPRPQDLAAGALTLTRMRELIAEVVASREDDDLHLISGLDLLGAADAEAGRLPDDLHPDPAGYRLMAERFTELVFAEGRPFAAYRRAAALT